MLRGEVWLVELDPTRGDELAKTRPAVIIGADDIGRLALKIVIPLTDWKSRYSKFSWMIRLTPDGYNGLSKLSAADTFQVRSISTERFVRKLGELSYTDINRISDALKLTLDIF